MRKSEMQLITTDCAAKLVWPRTPVMMAHTSKAQSTETLSIPGMPKFVTFGLLIWHEILHCFVCYLVSEIHPNDKMPAL